MSSTEGNFSASLRPRVGPRPGVSDSASQYKDCVICRLVPDMQRTNETVDVNFADCTRIGKTLSTPARADSLIKWLFTCAALKFPPSVFSTPLLSCGTLKMGPRLRS